MQLCSFVVQARSWDENTASLGYVVVNCKLKYSWGIEQVSILTK